MLFAPDPAKPGISDRIWIKPAEEMTEQDKAEAANKVDVQTGCLSSAAESLVSAVHAQ
jgi:hypothetical protein